MSSPPPAIAPKPELILVHGWGMHAGVWDAVAEALQPHARVQRFLLPGHGGLPATPFDLMRLTDLLAEATPSGAMVVGWSLGGLTALALAHRQPQALAGLVLVASTPCFVQRPGWVHGWPQPALAEFNQGLEQDVERTLRGFVGLQSLGDTQARPVGRALTQLVRSSPPSPCALADGMKVLATTDLRPWVPGIRVPTLVLHGLADRVVPPAAGQWLSLALPIARWHPLPDCGHAPMLSQPQLVATAVAEFLQQHEA